MYKVSDLVIHINEGLSVIKDKVLMNEKEYFVVINSETTNSEISYIPVEKASQMLRNLYTKEQAEEFIAKLIKINPEFTSNTKQRRDGIKKRLYSGEMDDLGYLIKQLYLFMKQPESDKTIRFGPVDIAMLKSALKRVSDEFALIYDKKPEEIQEYIFTSIQKNQ